MIKTAWGGRSLNTDFRKYPPQQQRYKGIDHNFRMAVAAPSPAAAPPATSATPDYTEATA